MTTSDMFKASRLLNGVLRVRRKVSSPDAIVGNTEYLVKRVKYAGKSTLCCVKGRWYSLYNFDITFASFGPDANLDSIYLTDNVKPIKAEEPVKAERDCVLHVDEWVTAVIATSATGLCKTVVFYEPKLNRCEHLISNLLALLDKQKVPYSHNPCKREVRIGFCTIYFHTLGTETRGFSIQSYTYAGPITPRVVMELAKVRVYPNREG